jgi:hypothetical protein
MLLTKVPSYSKLFTHHKFLDPFVFLSAQAVQSAAEGRLPNPGVPVSATILGDLIHQKQGSVTPFLSFSVSHSLFYCILSR